ncbi:MAG: hypothetical protein ACYDBS_11955, partial [Acidimicrobiales bacterium]
ARLRVFPVRNVIGGQGVVSSAGGAGLTVCPGLLGSVVAGDGANGPPIACRDAPFGIDRQ